MEFSDGANLRILRSVLAIFFAVTVLVVLQAGPALAHAELIATEPADHASLDEPPTEVVLTFTEEVTALPGAIRVFDANGERVDEGSVQGAAGIDRVDHTSQPRFGRWRVHRLLECRVPR